MNQEHLNLAEKFNSFAYDLISNEKNVKNNVQSLNDDELYRRIIFNKYYYALYHKYLAYDDELSSKSGSGKHKAILTKIESCQDPKLLQIYIKLLNLRIWADYKLDNDQQALSVNLASLNSDVWNIIKRTNINC